MNNKLIVDVREEDEFKRGHIEGSVNIPMSIDANNDGNPESIVQVPSEVEKPDAQTQRVFLPIVQTE